MERNKAYDDFMDMVEALLSEGPLDLSYTHVMTPGLYVRSVAMPAGSAGVSKIHRTEHVFMLTKGKVFIGAEGEGVIEAVAPFMQITSPGTRRVILSEQDSIWTTVHSTKYNFTFAEWSAMGDDEKNSIIDEFEAEIIEPHDNLLLHNEPKEVTE